MTDSVERQAITRAPQEVGKNLNGRDLTREELAELFSLVAPGLPLRALPSLFPKPVPLGTVKAWRYGHVRMPAWAVAALRWRLERAQQIADHFAPGPGKRVGYENLRRWNARNKG